jgi:undecaprenyl-diphosphatase
LTLGVIKETFKGETEATYTIVLLMANGFLYGREVWDKNDGRHYCVGLRHLGHHAGIRCVPGVSRSGTALTVLLMRNIRLDIALIISFLISVPAVLGALVVDYSYKALIHHSNYRIPVSIAASMLIGSFAIGYLSMDMLILFTRRIDFPKFCMVFGLIAAVIAVVIG